MKGALVVRIVVSFLLGALALLGGCVALTSEIEGDGVVYHLPKSVLVITVREMTDGTAGHTWYEIGPATLNAEGQYVKEQTSIPEETIPDPRHRYTIRYNPNVFSDDRLCISRRPNGLLVDVQFASDDRTPQIAFNISRFLAGAISPEKKAGYSFQKRHAGTEVVLRQFVGKVDPFEPGDDDIFNTALSKYFRAPVRISFTRMRKLIKESTKNFPKGCDPKKGCSQHAWGKRCEPGHICYRTRLTLPVDLMQRKSGVGEVKPVDDPEAAYDIVDMSYADVVNAWDIGAISVERAFLVQKITKFRFDRGALVASIMRKPSEVEELSLLPINVLNAALSTPSGLWMAAFAGNNKFKEDTIKEMATLTQQVKNLNEVVKGLEIGVSGATVPTDKTDYVLNCEGETRSGLTNILGDTWLTK